LLENNVELKLYEESERQVSLYEICQSQLKETSCCHLLFISVVREH
jgi:hypothetical protein